MIIVTQDITIVSKMQNVDTEEIENVERHLTSVLDINDIASYVITNHPHKDDMWIVECMDIYKNSYSICTVSNKEDALILIKYLYDNNEQYVFENIIDIAKEIDVKLVDSKVY